MSRRTAGAELVVVASLSGLWVAACGAEGASSMPEGVVLLAERDVTGEPPSVVFAAVPDFVVTTDGRVIHPPPVEFATTGELLPDMWVQEISPEGIDAVAGAVDAGRPPASHAELQTLIGSELGPVEFYLPDSYRFTATALGAVGDFEGAATPVLEWPDSASTALIDAGPCTVLPEIEVGEAFETAAEGSAFVDAGVVYGVVAAQNWPGAPC